MCGRYRPLFREISLFPRLELELGQIGGSDRGMYNELWKWVNVIVRNILLVSEYIRELLLRFRRRRNM